MCTPSERVSRGREIFLNESKKRILETAYNEIISSFVDKYGLSRGLVIAEIERTFSSMLSRWHQKDVIAMFSDDRLQALAYHQGPGGIVQVPVDLLTLRGLNTLERILDTNLGKTACLEEVHRYKRLEHGLYWGEILKKKSDQSLLVEIEIEPRTPIIATCLGNHIGVHERDELLPGQRLAFHLRRVDPVNLNGTFRVRVLVDRVSKYLVEKLLQSKLSGNDCQIRCLKRYVGQKSFVEANHFLPKKIILDASRELKEHIQVKIRK